MIHLVRPGDFSFLSSAVNGSCSEMPSNPGCARRFVSLCAPLSSATASFGVYHLFEPAGADCLCHDNPPGPLPFTTQRIRHASVCLSAQAKVMRRLSSMGRAESVTVRSSLPLPVSSSPSVFDRFARVLCSICAGATQYRGAPFRENDGRFSCLRACGELHQLPGRRPRDGTTHTVGRALRSSMKSSSVCSRGAVISVTSPPHTGQSGFFS